MGTGKSAPFLEESRSVRDEKVREEKRHQQKTLRLTRLIAAIITVAFVISAGLAYLAVKGAKKAKRKALEAHYNLARVFDEKAMNALESNQYRKAWLYMTAALRQEIDSRKSHLRPSSAGVLLTPGVTSAAFRERWFSPAFDSHFSPLICVAFSPDGKTIVSGSDDKTRRLWDMRIFNLFLKGGKPTPLFFTFSEGAEFFWGVRLEGFEYKNVDRSSNVAQKFLPLLDEPAPGQTKFEQILQWAEKQMEENR